MIYQSVKPADISRNRFDELMTHESTHQFQLHTQFRCKGGDAYIQYVREMLTDLPPVARDSFDGYDFKLYTDCGKMTDAIHQKEAKYELCRTVAGYAWKWVSKDDPTAFDIQLDGRSYRWNTVDKDWVNHDGSIDEIGCIHTIQGYDLNYCAVIFGWEIDYDLSQERFVINKTNYFDNPGKAVSGNKKMLEEYILNIYKTLLTRGIRGTYVYACNPGMRSYLSRFIPTFD